VAHAAEGRLSLQKDWGKRYTRRKLRSYVQEKARAVSLRRTFQNPVLAKPANGHSGEGVVTGNKTDKGGMNSRRRIQRQIMGGKWEKPKKGIAHSDIN